MFEICCELFFDTPLIVFGPLCTVPSLTPLVPLAVAHWQLLVQAVAYVCFVLCSEPCWKWSWCLAEPQWIILLWRQSWILWSCPVLQLGCC